MNPSSPIPVVVPAKDDPAWQPPRDPLKGDARAAARLIHREVPLITVQTNWTVADVRAALAALPGGQFDRPAQLVDAMVGDPRVQATMGSRTGGLFGRPVKFTPSRLPGVDPEQAKACLDAWRLTWPRTMTEPVLSELQQWAIGLGFGLGQLLWDTSEDIWCPYVRVFHPRYTYFHFTLRALVANTLDGQVQVTPGDGHWLLHAPHGEYRGWMRASVRAIAQPWLICALAYRDFARWSERHGFPVVLGRTPAAADNNDKTLFLTQLSTLGQESVVECPRGVDGPQNDYDLAYLEAKDGSWQGFDGLIQRCEMSIVLALLFQNLTTEVKEGSFAAAREHGDVKQSALEADARALAWTVYTQVARPFAQINFGDADLAPMTEWDILPTEQREVAAKTLLTFAQAMAELRKSGIGLKATSIGKVARDFGIDLSSDDFEAVALAPAPAPGAPPAPASAEAADRIVKALDRFTAKRKGKSLSSAVRKIDLQLRRDEKYFAAIMKDAETFADVVRNAQQLDERRAA